MSQPTNNMGKMSFLKECVKIVTNNFWLKFLSLVFSVVLFFIVRTDNETTSDRSYISMTTDKLVQKNLPVKVPLKGEPASGFVVSNVTVIPSVIKVLGSKQDLMKMEFINTFAVDIEGAHDPITMMAPIDNNDKLSLKFAQTDVQVHINFAKAEK